MLAEPVAAEITVPVGMTAEEMIFDLTPPTELDDKTGDVTISHGDRELCSLEGTITDEYYNEIHGIKEVEEKDSKDEPKKGIPGVVKVILAAALIIVIVLAGLMGFVGYKRKQMEKKRRERRAMRMREMEERRYD